MRIIQSAKKRTIFSQKTVCKRIIHLVLVLSLLSVFFSLSSQSASALFCCVSASAGCSQEAIAGNCPAGSQIRDIESGESCADVGLCDYGACCGDSVPQNAYLQTRYECTVNYAQGSFTPIGDWQFDESIYESEANTICSSDTVSQCRYTSCDGVNTEPCYCGSELLDPTEGEFCCSQFSYIAESGSECSAPYVGTPYCSPDQLFDITGTITDTNGTAVAGAVVVVGSVSNTSAADGSYSLSSLPQGSGFIYVTKLGYETISEEYQIVNSDITLDFTLSVVETTQQEICDNLVDDDGDGAIDYCDIDCNSNLSTNYIFEDDSLFQTPEANCTDGIDNDCDGLIDCADSNCEQAPSCVTHFCGDGTCDIESPYLENSYNCPSDCGTPVSVCGDGILQPEEDCEFERVGSDWILNQTRPIPEDETTPECGTPNSTSPCKFKAVCGNDILEYGEECEPALLGDSPCPNACSTSQCQCISYQVCGDGIVTGTEECEAGRVSNCGGTACDTNNCLCELGCEYRPEITNITGVVADTDEQKVTVTWGNTDCEPYIENFLLVRCTMNPDNPLENCDAITEYDTSLELEGDTFTYIDENIETTTDYCYRLATVYDSTTYDGAVPFSEKRCVQTGDEICYTVEDSFCRGNSVYSCDPANNRVKTTADDDCSSPQNYPPSQFYEYQCQQTSQGASCQEVSKCTLCNGLFEMFYYTGKARSTQGALVDCLQFPHCHIDYSSTAVNKYYQCSKVYDCYDYASQGACETNSCDLINPCQWNSFSNLSTVGVCSPVNTSQQECERCSANARYLFDGNYIGSTDPLFERKATPDKEATPYNRFFGECGADTCALYGACMYSDDICRSIDDAGCHDYATQQECVNSPQNNLIGPLEVSLDMNTYAGTNQFISRSDDRFGFGVCKWDQNRCFKDANDNDQDDCVSIPKQSPDYRDCVSDLTPPTTTLDIGSRVSRNLSTFIYVEQGAITYACLTEEGNTCYPSRDENSLYQSVLRHNNETGQEQMFLGPEQIIYQSYDQTGNPLPAQRLSVSDLSSGDYTLYYFSEDINHNLEIVKSKDVFVDATEPVVSIDSSAVVDRGQIPWTNNLSISFEAYDQEGPGFYGEVVCSLRLITENNPQEVYSAYSIEERPGNEWELFYPTLGDGIYYLDYECVDAVGNIAADQHMIELEGDTSITNLLPRGPLATTTVEVSAETQYPGTCRYDSDLIRYEGMDEENTLTSDASGTYHYTTFTGLTENMLHRYYVACQFDNGEVTELNPHDAFVFSIDTLPPRIRLETIPEPYSYNNQLWYNNRSIDQQGVSFTLTCLDQAIYDPMTNIDWSFGCNSLFFCQSENPGCTPVTTNSITFQNTVNTTQFFSYYGIDSGENEPTDGQKKIDIPLRYDDESPQFELALFDDGRPTNKLTAKTYTLQVSASEPLQDGLLMVGFETGSCDVSASTFTSTDTIHWNGTITIPNQNRCEDIDGNATFFAYGVDVHNRAGNEILNGSTVYIDTTPPDSFSLEPTLRDYASYRYPLIYNGEEDIYYTGDNRLYVSGFTEERLTIEAYQNNTNPSYTPLYSHAVPTLLFEDTLMNAEGDIVYINGDVTDDISTEMFLAFSDQGAFRRDYKQYKKHYDIIGINYVSEQELDRTEISISPPVPQQVSTGSVLFYDSIYPAHYFSGQIKLKPFTYTDVFFRVRDLVNNTLRYPESPEFLTFYSDPTVPEYIEETITPAPGSATNNPEQQISIQVRKPIIGVDMRSFRLNASVSGNYTVTEEEDGDYTYYTISFYPTETMNGTIQAHAEVLDQAGHFETYDWSFTVDTTLPSEPYVYINNSLEYEGKIFSDTNPTAVAILFRDEYDVELLDFSLHSGVSLDEGNVECRLGQEAENIVREQLNLEQINPSTEPTGTFGSSGISVTDTQEPEDEDFRGATGRLEMYQFLLQEDLGPNDYLCTFDIQDPAVQTLLSCPQSQNGQPCTYSARIQARKILSEESSTTGEFRKTIVLDDSSPQITQSSLSGTTSIRPGSTLAIEVTAANEPHGLFTDLVFDNVSYDLSTVHLNGTSYLAQWNIPGSLAQGSYQGRLNYHDPLGNAVERTKPFIVDVFPPDTDNLTLRVLNDDMIKRFNGTYVTKDANVMKLNGELSDIDIVRVVAVLEDELYEAQVNTFTDSSTFYLEIPIQSNAQGEDRLNSVELTITDQAGYESDVTVELIKDLSPPILQGRRLLDRFAFGNFG